MPQTALRSRRAFDFEPLEVRRLLAAGVLDSTFGTGGKTLIALPNSRIDVEHVAFQSDGKAIILALREQVVAKVKVQEQVMLRVDTAGALDKSFAKVGWMALPKGGWLNSVTVQKDGKILAAGHAGQSFEIMRFLSSGAADGSFGSGGKVTGTLSGAFSAAANDLAVQADGKIVVVGNIKRAFAAARFNSNGTLDSTFASKGWLLGTSAAVNKSNAVLSQVLIQPDGKILACGAAPDAKGSFDGLMLRLKSDGTYDISFARTGRLVRDLGSRYDQFVSPRLAANGYIIVANLQPGAIYRLRTDGSADTSFGASGKVATPTGFVPGDLLVQGDGKIVTTGYKSRYCALRRYNVNGSVDASFGTAGQTLSSFSTGNDFGNAAAIRADGKIFVVGEAGAGTTSFPSSFAFARYSTDFSTSTISGTVFIDANGNGLRDASEKSQAGWRVFIDSNNNGVWDSKSEKGTITDPTGNFKFTGLASGTYRVRAVVIAGWRATNPSVGYYDVSFSFPIIVSPKLFGQRKIA